MLRTLLLLSIMQLMTACGQAQETMKEKNNNSALICDPDTGMCAIPGHEHAEGSLDAIEMNSSNNAAITIQYFSDPICSSCWGVEPQLRKLKLAYGDAIRIDMHMGGLLPGWEGYNGGGITSPADVAVHWDEASAHYRMPIIGDVWIEDPLASSYPPSIAYKAAELQGIGKAERFMRRIREMVFMEKKNIARSEVQLKAATQVELDTTKLKNDIAGAAKALFNADLTLARAMGVRGFPSMFFSNENGERQLVYGSRPYGTFEDAVKKLAPDLKPAPLPTSIEELFDRYDSWTAQEAAVVLGISHDEARKMLSSAEKEGKLSAIHTRNGSVWHRADRR